MNKVTPGNLKVQQDDNKYTLSVSTPIPLTPPHLHIFCIPFDTTFPFLFPQPVPACEAAQGVVEAQRNRPRLKRAVSAPTRANRDACGVAAAFF